MEAVVRFGVFFGILLLMVAWGLFHPKHSLRLDRLQRWPINFSLATLNVLVLPFRYLHGR